MLPAWDSQWSLRQVAAPDSGRGREFQGQAVPGAARRQHSHNGAHSQGRRAAPRSLPSGAPHLLDYLGGGPRTSSLPEPSPAASGALGQRSGHAWTWEPPPMGATAGDSLVLGCRRAFRERSFEESADAYEGWPRAQRDVARASSVSLWPVPCS